MEFEVQYTPEQEAFRSEVRAWVEQNAPKDLVHSPEAEEITYEQWLKRREFGRKLGAKGWLWPTLPPEHGGGGLSIDKAVILEEVLDEVELTLPPYYDSGARLGAVANLLLFGTEGQKREFLHPMVRGEVVTFMVLTEPEAGSDLASVKTRAIRDGDEYVINGHKTFIGASHDVDYLWTLCVTDPDGPRHQNLSFLIIPSKLPGVTIMPLDLMMGGEGGAPSGHKNSIFFDDVHVPATNLVGGENNGWKVANTGLEIEHGGGGRVTRDRFRERLLDYCSRAQVDGKRMSQDSDVRDQLAEIFAKTEILRLFGLRNYWIRHARQPRSYEGSQTSYTGKMTGLWMTSAILQALGYPALTNDPQWRAVDGYAEGQQRSGMITHGGGTADIQKLIMARRIGVGRNSREEAHETV